MTEVGRQPWIVYGVMLTAKGVSGVTVADVATTLAAFVLIYTALRRHRGCPDDAVGAATARRARDAGSSRRFGPSLVY